MTIAVDMGRKATKTNKQTKFLQKYLFFLLSSQFCIIYCTSSQICTGYF